LPPGQWLRQETLAREFGVSSIPVREALDRLVAEGLAQRIPYKGVKVITLSPEELVDICATRLLLEGLAARLAAARITVEELELLRQNIVEAEQCTRQAHMARRRELNTEFHLAICRACGLTHLLRVVEMLWKWFPSVMVYEGIFRQETLSPARLQRETKEHLAILQALTIRDAQQAEAEVRHHIRNVSRELAEVLGIPEEDMPPLDSL